MDNVNETECFNCHITIIGRVGLQLCSECQMDDEVINKLLDRNVALARSLKAVTDKLDHICTYCDDGFVGSEEWEVIGDARAILAGEQAE